MKAHQRFSGKERERQGERRRGARVLCRAVVVMTAAVVVDCVHSRCCESNIHRVIVSLCFAVLCGEFQVKWSVQVFSSSSSSLKMKSRKQLEALAKAKKEQEERQKKRDEELRWFYPPRHPSITLAETGWPVAAAFTTARPAETAFFSSSYFFVIAQSLQSLVAVSHLSTTTCSDEPMQ